MRLLPALLLSTSLFAQTPVSVIRPRPNLPIPTINMHVETIPLLGTPAGATTLSYTLKATPISSMGGFAYYTSSLVGGDAFVPVPSITGTLSITLPAGITFTAADTITVVYWSVN